MKREEKKSIKEKAIQLYKNGSPIKDIVSETGLSESTIIRIVRSSNIEIRPAYAPKKISKEIEDKVVNMYKEEKNTIKSIMEATGVRSEQTIYRILKANNITLRKK